LKAPYEWAESSFLTRAAHRRRPQLELSVAGQGGGQHIQWIDYIFEADFWF
jgi:hypothetical protein